MTSSRRLASILLATALLSTALLVVPAGPVATGMAQGSDVEELRQELNATQAELEKVKKERDDYAQRLQDSTTILIIALFLLAGSYVVFYVNARRAKIAYLEFQRKAGVNPDGTKAPPRRRRRG